jgi:hypothetical protein
MTLAHPPTTRHHPPTRQPDRHTTNTFDSVAAGLHLPSSSSSRFVSISNTLHQVLDTERLQSFRQVLKHTLKPVTATYFTFAAVAAVVTISISTPLLLILFPSNFFFFFYFSSSSSVDGRESNSASPDLIAKREEERATNTERERERRKRLKWNTFN